MTRSLYTHTAEIYAALLTASYYVMQLKIFMGEGCPIT